MTRSLLASGTLPAHRAHEVVCLATSIPKAALSRSPLLARRQRKHLEPRASAGGPEPRASASRPLPGGISACDRRIVGSPLAHARGSGPLPHGRGSKPLCGGALNGIRRKHARLEARRGYRGKRSGSLCRESACPRQYFEFVHRESTLSRQTSELDYRKAPLSRQYFELKLREAPLSRQNAEFNFHEAALSRQIRSSDDGTGEEAQVRSQKRHPFGRSALRRDGARC